MARKLLKPISQKFGEREIYRDQKTFEGMIHDVPHSEIPDDYIARIANGSCYGQYARGRNGTTLWQESNYPALTDPVYSLSQSANIVTIREGGTFSLADVSNYIVWDSGHNNEITGYISPTQATVSDSATRTGISCYKRGRINGRDWHNIQKKIIHHIGQKFYIANDIQMSGWTEVILLEGTPSNANSTFDEMDELFINSNSGGTFKIVLDTPVPYAFRINSRVPRTRISGNVREGHRKYGRRYLYAGLRLTGDANIRNRNTLGSLVEWESGTNYFNEDLKDYGEVWTETKIGNKTNTQGRIIGAALATADMDASGVWGIITNGTLNITYISSANVSRTENVFVDFTGVMNMTEVADRIDAAAKAFFPDITIEFIDDHFLITSGEVNGTSLSWITNGTGGTNIADNMLCRNGDGGSLSTGFIYEDSSVIGTLEIEQRSELDTTKQRHWTHYAVYGTLDTGVNGTDPITGIGNNPERYVWIADVRVAGAFYASKNVTGLVTATVGEFELADEGSVIEWEDGDRDTITQYISSSQVRVAYDNYFDDPKSLQAAAIGNGSIARASQAGYRVTITNGSGRVTSNNIGDTVFWSDGTRSYITRIISGTVFDVHVTATKSTQGLTFGSQRRNFNDSVSDDILRARVQKGSWLLQQRFWTEMPIANIVAVTSAMMFQCKRGDSEIQYCTYTPTTKYLAGCYHSFYQVETGIKDAITHMTEFPNRLIVWCANKTWGGPINESTQLAIEGTGSFITIFNGLQLVDGNIGMRDWGSLQMPVHGMAYLLTMEPAYRQFDGYSYGPNLAEVKDLPAVMDEIRGWHKATASAYHPNIGLLLWGLIK